MVLDDVRSHRGQIGYELRVVGAEHLADVVFDFFGEERGLAAAGDGRGVAPLPDDAGKDNVAAVAVDGVVQRYAVFGAVLSDGVVGGGAVGGGADEIEPDGVPRFVGAVMP